MARVGWGRCPGVNEGYGRDWGLRGQWGDLQGYRGRWGSWGAQGWLGGCGEVSGLLEAPRERWGPWGDKGFLRGGSVSGCWEGIGSLTPHRGGHPGASKEDVGVLVTPGGQPCPPTPPFTLLCREAFCQQAPVLLDYLHNILQKYPDGGQILKVRPPGTPHHPGSLAQCVCGAWSSPSTSPRTLLASWASGSVLSFWGLEGPRWPATNP